MELRQQAWVSWSAGVLLIANLRNRKDTAKDPEAQENYSTYQHIFNESKTRRKNLAMAWIDNKKAYDMVPQSWIINCFKMYKILDEVINFIERTMKTWNVELTAGGRSLAEAKIQRDIFQGDAQPPLLFIIAMMPLNPELRKCWAVWDSCRMGYRNQWQIRGRKAPSFNRATFGWASCNLCPLCIARDLAV